MIHTYTHGEETWIDVNSGTPTEIQKVVDEHRIHPFIAHELLSVTRKPHIEVRDGYIYCILHFPAWKHSHGKDSSQEVDFVIGEKLLLTVRYDTIDSLEKFGKSLEIKEALHREDVATPQHILLNLLGELYRGVLEELSLIEELTDDITSQIFNGNEKEMVISISKVIRTLIEFKRTTDIHKDVLESLHKYGVKMFGEGFGVEMEKIMSEYAKMNTSIRSNLEMLRDLRETNNSLLTTKQNETVKQLTVLGFIIVPLSFIAVLFAIRPEGMPFLDHPYGFWIVVGIMITSVAVTVAYASHKKWL